MTAAGMRIAANGSSSCIGNSHKGKQLQEAAAVAAATAAAAVAAAAAAAANCKQAAAGCKQVAAGCKAAADCKQAPAAGCKQPAAAGYEQNDGRLQTGNIRLQGISSRLRANSSSRL